jgi:DNA-binding beta-propeller fold protein YncE
MKRKTFRLGQSANAVAVLALLGSIAIGLSYLFAKREALDQPRPWLVGAVQAQGSAGATSPQGARSAASGQVAPTERPIRLVRPALRSIHNAGGIFSAVAVDPVRNEIVVQDETENLIYVYDRLTNTPPAASMSEPKRIIGGPRTGLSENCGIYIDPKTGDIYSVTGDGGDLLIFSNDAKGNVPPVRRLRTPRRMWGIAADEEANEIFIATQWPAGVFVYRKEAEGYEAPLRMIEGDRTLLAASNGIAVDSKNQAMYVSNWGGTSSLRDGMGYSGIPVYGEGEHRAWELPMQLQFFFRDGRFVPGSGRFSPPSILTFPLKGSGNIAPERVLQGPKTQLDWPTHMAVDVEHQELYVANSMDNSVVVFRAGDSGNVEPIRVIKGPRTSINTPQGVHFDAKNQELVVSNWGNHSVCVFPRLANGDVAPIRKIRNAPEDIPSPMISHLGAMAYDSKRDEILAQQ